MLQVEIGVARIVVVVDEVPRAAEIVGKAVAVVVDCVRLPPAPAFTGIRRGLGAEVRVCDVTRSR